MTQYLIARDIVLFYFVPNLCFDSLRINILKYGITNVLFKNVSPGKPIAPQCNLYELHRRNFSQALPGTAYVDNIG